jgi:hypothetical protein
MRTISQRIHLIEYFGLLTVNVTPSVGTHDARRGHEISARLHRLQLKLFLGFYLEILQSRKYSDHRFLFPKGRHIHHNAILRSRVAYLELDPLPAGVRSDYPMLENFWIDKLGLSVRRDRQAGLAGGRQMEPVQIV